MENKNLYQIRISAGKMGKESSHSTGYSIVAKDEIDAINLAKEKFCKEEKYKKEDIHIKYLELKEYDLIV